MKRNKLKNNILKILFFNFLFFGLLLAIANKYIEKNISSPEFAAFYSKISYLGSNKVPQDRINIKRYETEKSTVKSIENNELTYKQFCGESRIVFNKNYKKNPIIVLGCSYAYGHGLKREETFPYILSNLAQRPVYSFAQCGEQILNNIDRLSEFGKSPYNYDLINNADYIIYIYMHDHINRFLNVQNIYLYDLYEDIIPLSFKENNLYKKVIKIPLIKFLFSSVKFRMVIKGVHYADKTDSFLKALIIQSQKKLKELAPNAKFIIILYEQKLPDTYSPLKIKFDSDRINSKIWTELQNENNIIVVHTKEITGVLFDKNYKLKEDIADWHPNARVWSEFTPVFVKQYIK